MIRGSLIFITFLSVLFFPWPLTTLLTIVSAFSIPLMPFAIGIFADTLYYVPSQGLPFFTIFGALATGLAIFVHKWLRTGIIRG